MPDCLVASLEIKLIGAPKIAAGFCRLSLPSRTSSTMTYVMPLPYPHLRPASGVLGSYEEELGSAQER